MNDKIIYIYNETPRGPFCNELTAILLIIGGVLMYSIPFMAAICSLIYYNNVIAFLLLLICPVVFGGLIVLSFYNMYRSYIVVNDDFFTIHNYFMWFDITKSVPVSDISKFEMHYWQSTKIKGASLRYQRYYVALNKKGKFLLKFVVCPETTKIVSSFNNS